MGALKRLGQLFLRHRRRLAPLVLLAGAVVVGSIVFDAAPRETEIRYDLGPSHARVVEARISYASDGDIVQGVRFQWADGAPESVRHTVELAPGRYQIRAELTELGGHRVLERALRVPADGVVRIDLFEAAVANRVSLARRPSAAGHGAGASADAAWAGGPRRWR